MMNKTKRRRKENEKVYKESNQICAKEGGAGQRHAVNLPEAENGGAGILPVEEKKDQLDTQKFIRAEAARGGNQ